MVVLHVPALERVNKMRDRGVFRGNGNLHPALRHHAIGIAETQLGRENRFYTGMMSMQRRGTTSASTTDNQDIA